MSFLLYKHTDGGVLDDFPKISDHFPKISEVFLKLLRRPDETFPNIFREFQKNSEDVRRLLKTFDDTVNHRFLHMWGYLSFLSICYHSVYHWLLYNKFFNLPSAVFIA